MRYQDGTDQSKATQALSKSMSTHPGVTVTSSADQKAQMDKIINIMLGMVVGLLVISVIIAIVGVANTLGLSVVERTREIGLLRALGLTRAQVRSMFGKEALMLSGIAAILGIALGIGYGIAGSHALLAPHDRRDIRAMVAAAHRRPRCRAGRMAGIGDPRPSRSHDQAGRRTS